jgi:hypothetical protein
MTTAFLVSSPRSAALRAINYAREIELLSRPKSGAFRATRLGSLLSSCGDSYWTVFTRLDCAREHGVELITQTDMFAVEPEGRIIRRDSMPHPERHEVKRWQVLIAGAGQMGTGNLFGRSIIADARLAGRFLGPHAVALTFAEAGSDTNLWTYAFLNTELGLKAVKSCAFGTSVPGVRIDLLTEIPIPIPSDPEILSQVAAIIRKCVKQRELYLRELQEARRIVEELPDMREARSMCADRKPRAAKWSGALLTLNAWNYASAGEALPFLVRKWRARLADLVPRGGLFRGGRYQRIPCEHPFGIDFMSQRDVFQIRPTSRRIAAPAVPKTWVYVPEFSLLAGGQGTLGEGELFGQVSLVTPDIAKAGITEHLLRIQPASRAASGLLYAFLSTLVGRRLLRSTGVGTKLLSLRPDLVFALPVPEIGPEVSAKVVAHLERASAARVSAVEAEGQAIRIVEEALPAWLA